VNAVPVDNFAVVAFEVHGAPVGQGSTMRTTTGHVRHANAQRLRPWRNDVATAAVAAMEGRPPWTGAVRIECVFGIARPRGHWRTGARADELRPSAPAVPTSNPDLDKLARAILDALTGIVYRDDAQVVDLQLSKWYGAPGVQVWATTDRDG
jgi:Holliday junction resolvase RusA-like endonuclease